MIKGQMEFIFGLGRWRGVVNLALGNWERITTGDK